LRSLKTGFLPGATGWRAANYLKSASGRALSQKAPLSFAISAAKTNGVHVDKSLRT
jgi:hypothetical protein